jgi:hypothetical protein
MKFIHGCSAAKAAQLIKRMRIVKHFDYPDEHGNDLMRAVRIEEPGKPKKLWSERRVDGGWKAGGTITGLYQSHDAEIAAANGEWVFVVEGEDKARMLHRRGLRAVSAPNGTGGAKVYANGGANVMQGTKVAVLPDNNAPGVTYARAVAQHLHGVAHRIRIIDPSVWGKEGNDIANWLEATDAEGTFINNADELMRIVRRTKDWSPGMEPTRDAPRRQDGSLRIDLVTWEDIATDRNPQYCIDCILPAQGSVLAYGPRKIGKSYWGLDAAWHIAANIAYYGHAVRWGAVIYICLEGQYAIKARIEAIKRRHDSHGIPFFLITVPIKLALDIDALHDAIRATIGSRKVAALFVDTLNRSVHGSECSDEVMGEYMDAADSLVAAWSCAVVIVHHEGLAGGRPRGHTLLPAGVDAIIRIDGNRRGHVSMVVEEARHGKPGSRIDLYLAEADIGDDETGRRIDVMVVDRGEASRENDVTPAAGPRLTDNQRVILSHLEDIAGDEGRASISEWFDACRPNPAPKTRREKDAHRKSLTRTREKLEEEGLITVKGDNVFITR